MVDFEQLFPLGFDDATPRLDPLHLVERRGYVIQGFILPVLQIAGLKGLRLSEKSEVGFDVLLYVQYLYE